MPATKVIIYILRVKKNVLMILRVGFYLIVVFWLMLKPLQNAASTKPMLTAKIHLFTRISCKNSSTKWSVSSSLITKSLLVIKKNVCRILEKLRKIEVIIVGNVDDFRYSYGSAC